MTEVSAPARRRRTRRVGRWLALGAAVCVILLGLLVAIASQALPLLERHPEAVARFMSERARQPVEFDRLETRWTRRGPLIALHGLRLGPPGERFEIGRADVLVAIYAGLLPGRPLTELRIAGIEIVLEREADGRWRVHNLQGSGSSDPLGQLERLGEIQVTRARLRVITQVPAQEATLPRIDLRMRVAGARLRAGVRAWAADAQAPLEAVIDVQRHAMDGTVWVGGDRLDLRPWAALAGDRLPVEVERAEGRFGGWLTLADRRVDDVRLDLDLRALELRARVEAADPGETGADAPPAAALALGRLRGGARWHREADGWRLQVPRLEAEQAGAVHVVAGLAATEGARYGVQAERVDLAPLAAAAALVPDLPSALRAWLAAAAPVGRVEDLALGGLRDGGLAGSARLGGLGWAAVGDAPGIAGLGGSLRLDDAGGEFVFDAAPLRFDWQGAFVEPLEVVAEGRVAAWREPAGWRLETARLRVEGTGADAGLYAATARGGLLFPEGGGRPHLMLAAAVDPAEVPVAKRFWVRDRMPVEAVEWLDQGLLEGRVVEGEAVVAGDLAHWPFENGEGRFEAAARVEGARLHFHEGWPELTGLDAYVRFVGMGMWVDEARADIMGARIERGSAQIPDFRDAVLGISANGGGQAGALLDFLRATPVGARQAEALSGLRATGAADVAVELRIPLERHLGQHELRGAVSLTDGRLTDPRWRVDFTDVDGNARFGLHGFAAEDVSVRVEGHEARLSLAAGEPAQAPGIAFEAALQGRLPASVLVEREPALDWLAPWIDGTSDWQVSVAVPEGDPAGTRLRIESDLVGTDLRLPAPLRKSASVPLALRVEVPLPVEEGEIEVRLGALMRLRGALREDDGFGAAVVFGGAPPGPPPQRGIEVDGQVAVLDAAGWIGLAAGDSAEQVAALAQTAPEAAAVAAPGTASGTAPESRFQLNRVDLVAGELDVLDRAFNEIRLHLERDAEAATVVRVRGPEVLGSVRVPARPSEGIRGEFERLYWPAARLPGGADAATAETPPADDDEPAKVPPLRFDIADLRYGDAHLGRAELATWPKPEGMRIQRFTTDSPSLRIDASGDWTRLGGRSRSHFSIGFASNELGAMLDALGFAGVIEAGDTRATLVAGWPGSPGAFRLDALDGELTVRIGEGRLLDVEPGGAGRILGLLSLNALPRRLSLDFSDFFGRGLGFDEISGRFGFRDGRASTDDMAINGPAVQIHVRGEADLRAQTYDQTIEVLPKASGVLTAVGALAGGPVGAAVGAVAQQVFRAPFQQATRTVYHVTGPWREPEVAVVDRGPARPPQAQGEAATPPAAPPPGPVPAPAPDDTGD
ncbi:YhdP family protein [Coralloluteibacterium thermophilus]|uniref:YhdP family protein n=1 Tax=Coralloluteibacterium thermophilum TaxID=2707049 RepID=A0ABV9NP28_9GAMM